MKFAICDKDTKYLQNIQTYLVKKNPLDFEIVTYDSTESALEASLKCGFEILLVGENTYSAQVKEIRANKTIILEEDGFSRIEGYDIISKYQSANQLISQVLELHAHDEACTSGIRPAKNNTRLITFYSPEHHGAQSISALAAAQVLGERGEKVLYLNFHGFSGFQQMLGTSYEQDITDFMYFVLKGHSKLQFKLEGMKQNIRGVDFIPPASDYLELVNIKPSEWRQVMDLVMYSCDYNHIVVDMAETCKGFYEIIDISDRMYVLFNENSLYGRASLQHFSSHLSAREMNKVFEKLITYSIPYEVALGEVALQNLVLSEIGAYMRGVLG
jgi:hypothetical protein